MAFGGSARHCQEGRLTDALSKAGVLQRRGFAEVSDWVGWVRWGNMWLWIQRTGTTEHYCLSGARGLVVILQQFDQRRYPCLVQEIRDHHVQTNSERKP